MTKSPRGEYVWERTRPGLIELPCQHTTEGMEEMFARRRCQDDGEWGEVDVDDCYGKVEDLFKDIEKVASVLVTVLLHNVSTVVVHHRAFSDAYTEAIQL